MYFKFRGYLPRSESASMGNGGSLRLKDQFHFRSGRQTLKCLLVFIQTVIALSQYAAQVFLQIESRRAQKTEHRLPRLEHFAPEYAFNRNAFPDYRIGNIEFGQGHASNAQQKYGAAISDDAKSILISRR